MIRFEWDNKKALDNLKKHKVSFEEAITVFNTDQIRIFADESHTAEERLFAIGYSETQKMLVVIHCYREDEEVIRIISARKANKSEKKFFEGE